MTSAAPGASAAPSGFPSVDQLERWCARVCGAGSRATASPAHDALIDWLGEELSSIPGVEVRAEGFELRSWRPRPGDDLERAATLAVAGTDLPVAGAVPYTKPATARGPLVHLPAGTAITPENARGRVVLRDFPHLPITYGDLLGAGIHATPDLPPRRDEVWDRPGLADGVLHADLLAAGDAGAAGLVIGFDLPRRQVAAYHEPHKGTHYRVPGVFVGADERGRLLDAPGEVVELTVDAVVGPARTRNLHATVEGRSDERIVVVTHTDGTTWVQENGVAALVCLARYLAQIPFEERHRTVELAFTSAHLHISREGSVLYAAALDDEFERGGVAFVLALEHLGVRELVPGPRSGGHGRELRFTPEPEVVLWSVGPSRAMQDAVIDAVRAHGLPRTLVAPGLGAPVEGRVPEIVSFGGLGTPYHARLVPTMSVLTAPWSLWAPSFGPDAIDVGLMHRQLLAAATVIRRLAGLPRAEIAGGYLADRAARAAGAPTGVEDEPPEIAPEVT